MYGNAAFGERPYADKSSPYGLVVGEAVVSASLDFVIYAATRTVATNANDSVLASRAFAGTLSIPLNFTRTLIGTDIGTFSVQTGAAELNNQDGRYDLLPSTYTADGRPAKIKAWRKGDDYAKAFTIFNGVMASWFIDETRVAITLSDFSFKLAVPAQTHLYGGAGGADGDADLAQKPKPLAFGTLLNISPPLIDTSNLVYQVHDGTVSAISAVYDRAAALTPGADYATYAALIAASVAGGSFATCLAQGLFRLGSNAAGTVTADVNGDTVGGVFASTTANIIRNLIDRATVLVDPTDLYTSAFDNINTIQPAPVGYFLNTDSTQAVADAIANLMHGIGGWGAFRRDGTFELRRLDLPTQAVASFLRKDVIDIKREPLPTAMTPPSWIQRVPYQNNWTVQTTDVAGSVTAARKTFLAAANRLSQASSAAVQFDHPFAPVADPVQAYFANKADADAEALRLLNLLKVERALYRTTLPRKALALNLGDGINLSFPRFDLAAGRLMTVVEFTEDLTMAAGKVDDVEVVGYG